MRDRVAWGVLSAVVGAALAHAMVLYVDFVSDDAYISFRYAERLVDGHGLSWTDGPPVEGYTNLGWVLGLSVLELLGLRHVDGARVLGLAGFVASVLAASVDPGTLRPQLRRACSGGLSLAATGALAAWAMGGLEHTGLAGAVALAVVGLIHLAEGGRRDWLVALLLGGMVLIRADAPVLAAGALLGALLAAGQPVRWVAIGLVPLAMLVGQLAHRVWWFDDWVPNTARVKVSGTSERAALGLRWVGGGLLRHAVLVVGAGLLLPHGWRSPRWLVPGTAAITWCVYVAAVGGDIFDAWRQLVPALPLLAMMMSEAFARMALPDARVALLALLGLAVHLPLANAGHYMSLARLPKYEWQVDAMGRAMRAAWGKLDPLLAVDSAGALPYATRFRSLDMLGLNDAWLPRHPPPGYGLGGIGHDLGDASYVMRMQPDIVAFNSGLGSTTPKWPGGRALSRRKDFLKRYQLVRLGAVHGDMGIDGRYYLRRDGGPLGIVTEPAVGIPERMTIPAWFLASETAETAQIHGRRKAATWRVRVSEPRPGVVPALVLPEGTWLARPSSEKLTVRAVCGETRVEGPFVLARRRAVDLEVSAPQRSWAGALVLERTELPGTPCR